MNRHDTGDCETLAQSDPGYPSNATGAHTVVARSSWEPGVQPGSALRAQREEQRIPTSPQMPARSPHHEAGMPRARRRPGWVVVGLAWATFGIYAIIWSGLNWAEIKRVRQDPTMYPFWHAVSLFVPIYGLFRLHANYRLINELLATTRSTERVRPLAAIATLAGGNLLAAFPANIEQLVLLNVVVGMAMVSWAIYHGQSGMNAFWDAQRAPVSAIGVRLGERLLIGFGAGLWIVLILTLLTSPQ